jgi:hypothetical protein
MSGSLQTSSGYASCICLKATCHAGAKSLSTVGPMDGLPSGRKGKQTCGLNQVFGEAAMKALSARMRAVAVATVFEDSAVDADELALAA